MGFFSSLFQTAVNTAVQSSVQKLVTGPGGGHIISEIPAETTLYTSEQRVFGTPGISLQYAQNLPYEALRAGIDGEERVSEALNALAAQYPNTYVFHSVKLPGHLGDMDHIVVQGDRVLLIDAKNWKAQHRYDIAEINDEEVTITRDGEPFPGGDIHLPQQMREWTDYLLRHTVINSLNATLVIANQTTIIGEAKHSPFMLMNLETLKYAFEVSFTTGPQPPLAPQSLAEYVKLVQGFNYFTTGQSPVQAAVPVTAKKAPIAGGTFWLMIWSILNYMTLPFFFPVVGVSALILIVFTHIQLVRVNKRNQGGAGLLVATLAFSYVLFGVWLLGLVLVLASGILTPSVVM